MTDPCDFDDWDELDRRDEEINRGWPDAPFLSDELLYPSYEELYGRKW